MVLKCLFTLQQQLSSLGYSTKNLCVVAVLPQFQRRRRFGKVPTTKTLSPVESSTILGTFFWILYFGHLSDIRTAFYYSIDRVRFVVVRELEENLFQSRLAEAVLLDVQLYLGWKFNKQQLSKLFWRLCKWLICG